MEENPISLRHSFKLNGFFKVPQKCDIEKFLKAVYSSLEFSIILYPIKFSIEWYIMDGFYFDYNKNVLMRIRIGQFSTSSEANF